MIPARLCAGIFQRIDEDPVLPDELPPASVPPETPASAGGDGPHYDPLNIDDELKDSYLTYAMSVIISRALPDVRDGLKPSQRRILVAMNDLDLGPEPHEQVRQASSATPCGTITRTATGRSIRPWSAWPRSGTMRHRWSTGRATSARSPVCPPPPCVTPKPSCRPWPPRCWRTSSYDTVDFIDNYDGRYRSRPCCPSKFPNLLVNGSDGIAVGMATEIPPHNLARSLRRHHQDHRRSGSDRRTS